MIKALVGLRDWVDARLPIMRAWNTHMGKYYAPKNFNFWYFFGFLSLVVLVNQLLTGIWLTMSYTPSSEGAFASVEYIMRDVEFGWLIRYMHSTGASAFFVVVYLHMFRALLYGSYQKPRELIWIFGMLIFVVLMAEAFVGYVLPWGQMSYWGAQVIISLFGAIPVVGEDLVTWIRGDFLISGITLNRFFALHVVALPIVLLALVVLHLLALHEVGSNNPDGVDIKKYKDENGVPLDGIAFHPYYSVHDLQGLGVFLFIFCGVIFFMPEMGGFFLEYANFEEANALKTPAHIAPVWYFTPFYSVLRAVPDKFWGFVAFAASVAIPFLLPWLDRSPVKSWRYKGNITKVMLTLFVASFLILGVLGVKAPTPERTLLAQICSVFYFFFFLAMPIWSSMDKTKPVPERVTMDGGLSAMGVLGAAAVIAVLTVLPLKAVGAESEYACGSIPCDEITVDHSNKASLQSGAQMFMNYCFGCHSLQYQRYNRVAADLGIPEDLFEANLKFDTDVKMGALMNNAMDKQLAKQWFGATPPDLTLISRARQPEWLYTYLRTFYADPSRPYGVNNKVFKDVGMPHVLMDLQGMPECAMGPGHAANGGVKRDPLTGEDILDVPCGRLEVKQAGAMTTAEFDAAIYDLVNFLSYSADPVTEKRHRIGLFTLMFIVLFFVLAWLLNREYWKDVH
ncbi:Ubiquinol--cytochrome c reductase, cytochrome B subunit [Aequoribacter fuscus]|jgi:ubiquinol-cytochrome c reductase cytochrome b subunit|uniref:Cytochrome b n=1 Tax=Aequoribacter fuscus TaxID=2518989 RepID=F3L1M4_9GAMM|nr:ubiquinol-cytochrome c reductase [Aequoribacter fuscus]EGG29727.1 Ubiquinol--cytochrome c reductase, cytochrome B subunit [Aequoribacter fuscus]QHJ88744.1 ubiquinol-cytochrome c reductase [Aequoribacter fuscus]